MNDEWLMECAQRCSPADRATFEQLNALLPSRTQFTPYGSSAHTIRAFRMALEFVKPQRVLEIGFNLGHGALILLELGVQRLTSVEIRQDDQVRAAEVALKILYDRFELVSREALLLREDDRYDLIFIDGDHHQGPVEEDILLGEAKGCRFFLLDDWFPHWGVGVQAAIKNRGLTPLAILGNMALCEKL